MGFCIFFGFMFLGVVPLCFDPGYFRDTIGPPWWFFCWFLFGPLGSLLPLAIEEWRKETNNREERDRKSSKSWFSKFQANTRSSTDTVSRKKQKAWNIPNKFKDSGRLSYYFEHPEVCPQKRIDLRWMCPTCKTINTPLTKTSIPRELVLLKNGICPYCGKECSIDFNWKYWKYDVGVRYRNRKPANTGKTIQNKTAKANCINCGAPRKLNRPDCEYCGTLLFEPK